MRHLYPSSKMFGSLDLCDRSIQTVNMRVATGVLGAFRPLSMTTTSKYIIASVVPNGCLVGIMPRQLLTAHTRNVMARTARLGKISRYEVCGRWHFMSLVPEMFPPDQGSILWAG